MKKVLTIIFIAMTLVTFGQKAQSIDTDKVRIDRVCDNFMKLFAEGKTADAFHLLKQNSIINPSSIDTLYLTVERQMEDFLPGYGNMLSAEFISERKIKDFIAKRNYILKFDNYYLNFEFALYKTKKGWAVTNFKYGEDLTDLFK